MTWQNPYAVDGATLNAEILRIVAYHALGGSEGVARKGDARVTASVPADNRIHVGPGGVLLTNRYNGGSGQSYAMYQPDEDIATVTPSLGGGRTDLVVARIHDPQFAGSPPAPGEEDTYVYTETEVITGVPPNTDNAADLNLGYPAVALARITRGGASSIVTEANITDVRKLARARQQEYLTHIPTTAPSGDNLNAAVDTWERFPDASIFQVQVPEWAVVAKVTAFVEGLRKNAGGTGALRVVLQEDGVGTELTDINEPAPAGASDRVQYNLGGVIHVDKSRRGDSATFAIQGKRTGGTAGGWLSVDGSTSCMIRVLFEEQTTSASDDD